MYFTCQFIVEYYIDIFLVCSDLLLFVCSFFLLFCPTVSFALLCLCQKCDKTLTHTTLCSAGILFCDTFPSFFVEGSSHSEGISCSIHVSCAGFAFIFCFRVCVCVCVCVCACMCVSVWEDVIYES